MMSGTQSNENTAVQAEGILSPASPPALHLVYAPSPDTFLPKRICVFIILISRIMHRPECIMVINEE